MARAARIYLAIDQYQNILGGWTVKHEAITALGRMFDKQELWEGSHRFKSVPDNVGVTNQNYVDCDAYTFWKANT